MLLKFRRNTNPVKFDMMITLGLFKKFVMGDKETIYITPNDIWTYGKIEQAKYFCMNCLSVLMKKDIHLLNKTIFCLPCKKVILQRIKEYKDKQLALAT